MILAILISEVSEDNSLNASKIGYFPKQSVILERYFVLLKYYLIFILLWLNVLHIKLQAIQIELKITYF